MIKDKIECEVNYQPSLDRLSNVKPSDNFTGNDAVGIEIEVENFNFGNLEHFKDSKSRKEVNMINSHIVFKEDHSLRNGIELVSNPIIGAELDTFLDVVELFSSTSMSFGPRTSNHIHLNVLEFSPELLKNYVYIYSIFERCLFNAYAPSRIKNNFCKPIYNSNFLDNFKRILVHLYKGDIRRGSRSLSELRNIFNRYYALNVISIFKYGTIEFRHFPATLSKQLLTERVNFIYNLKNIAEKYSILELCSLLKYHIENDDILNFLNVIFPLCPTFVESFTNTNNIQVDDLISGYEDIRGRIMKHSLSKKEMIDENDKENIDDFNAIFNNNIG